MNIAKVTQQLDESIDCGTLRATSLMDVCREVESLCAVAFTGIQNISIYIYMFFSMQAGRVCYET